MQEIVSRITCSFRDASGLVYFGTYLDVAVERGTGFIYLCRSLPLSKLPRTVPLYCCDFRVGAGSHQLFCVHTLKIQVVARRGVEPIVQNAT